MWHAWHIYKIWWFKAICPTWCDWFPSCSVYPKITLYGKKKIKKPNKKKRNCIWIKLTVQYMCSMFCVLHVLVWNETSQTLTCFPNESELHAPQHMHHYTHTGMCTVRWNTEEIKTVRLLVDGLMKDEDSSFFSSSPLITSLLSPHSLSYHTNTHFYRLSWTHHPLVCSKRRRREEGDGN